MSQQGNCYFIAGTDTDVGKTLVATGLLAAAARKGVTTLAIKPVAAGCENTSEGLRNDDALKLQAQMSVELDYEQVNPVALQPPVAPHIAAAQCGQSLNLQPLVEHCRNVLEGFAGFALIEGAGGWRLPLNDAEYLSALPKLLGVPVILVVGMKLGCLNHALLTLEAIERDGVRLAGWVANQIDQDMNCFEENLAALKSRIGAPLLGVVPALCKSVEGSGSCTIALQAASFLAIEELL